MKRHHGFALVEVLVMLLALSIIVAIVMMALLPSAKKHSDQSVQVAQLKAHIECLADAKLFQNGVAVAHARTHKWPDEGVASVAALDEKLHGLGANAGDDLRHLDGSQRRPVTLYKGWTYDFKTHTTKTVNCGS